MYQKSTRVLQKATVKAVAPKVKRTRGVKKQARPSKVKPMVQAAGYDSDEEFKEMVKGKSSMNIDTATEMISNVMGVDVDLKNLTKKAITKLIKLFRTGVLSLISQAGGEASEVPMDDYHTWEPLTGAIMSVIEESSLSDRDQEALKISVAKIRDKLEDD